MNIGAVVTVWHGNIHDQARRPTESGEAIGKRHTSPHAFSLQLRGTSQLLHILPRSLPSSLGQTILRIAEPGTPTDLNIAREYPVPKTLHMREKSQTFTQSTCLTRAGNFVHRLGDAPSYSPKARSQDHRIQETKRSKVAVILRYSANITKVHGSTSIHITSSSTSERGASIS